MIDFSKFGIDEYAFGDTKFPIYKSLTLGEIAALQLLDTSEEAIKKLSANPAESLDFIVALVSLFLTSRVSKEWTTDNVAKLPVDLLLELFGVCCKEVRKVPSPSEIAEVLPIKFGHSTSEV
jgi:hypothetical protein